MSQQLINHNPDLKRLVDDGYEISIKANHLIMDNVPFVKADKSLARASLVSELSLSGDRTVRPHTHVMMFSGECPCDHTGEPISKIINSSQLRNLGDGLVIHHTFSSKPKIGYYVDFYEKMVTYEAILSSQAAHLYPGVTARTFRVIENCHGDSPFAYLDTATTRAGIGELTQKLALESVHIIGLGGTGAYVLDLMAKTPVRWIHLFDGDIFGQHNAFRAPGAASIDELSARRMKVDYFKERYSPMHRGIISHAEYLTEENMNQLKTAGFVFICLDNGEAKRLIIATLEEAGIPFIDVGMGLQMADDALTGMLRVTTSTPQMRSHIHEKKRIPLHSANENDLYSQNIQVADLNMMNAALAVMKWKKLQGFYLDLEGEHSSTLSIDGNHLLNEDAA